MPSRKIGKQLQHILMALEVAPFYYYYYYYYFPTACAREFALNLFLARTS